MASETRVIEGLGDQACTLPVNVDLCEPAPPCPPPPPPPADAVCNGMIENLKINRYARASNLTKVKRRAWS